MHRAEHPVAVGVELAAVGLDQAAEGVLVARRGRRRAAPAPARSGLWGRRSSLSRLDRRGGRKSSPPMSSAACGGLERAGTDASAIETPSSTWSSTPAICRAPARFYTQLCGWRAERIDAGCGSYWALELGGGIGGGVVECETERPLWLPYVEVAEIGEATERAPARGEGAAGAARGPGRVAERDRRGRRRGDRALAAEDSSAERSTRPDESCGLVRSLGANGATHPGDKRDDRAQSSTTDSNRWSSPSTCSARGC